MAKRFTYGGFTFVPDGTFKDHGIKKGKKEFYNISRALYYPNYGNVADGDESYDYDNFYKAAGDKKADVFLCEENGERYVPCSGALAVFDQVSDSAEEVHGRFERRRAEREKRERFVKQQALKNAMCLTDEQRKAINALREAAYKCCEVGMNFAANGTDMYVFRADTLKDITDNMAPMEGQVQIENGMYLAIENAWDVCEGLYANPKDSNN